MKYLAIIGANGFIGRNTCNYLKKRKIKFSAFGRTKSKEKSSYPVNLFTSFDEISDFENIIYLAEPSLLDESKAIDNKFSEKAQKNILDVLNQNNKNIIYLSSSSVYGSNGYDPCKTDSPTNPNSIYARSKLKCENLVLKNNGIVLRLGNIYGAHMSENNVLSKLIDQFTMNKKEIKIWNKKPIRDYLYIEDLLELFDLILDNKFESNVFNVGLGKSYSVEDLFQTLKKIYNPKEVRLIETKPTDKNSFFYMDIEKTKTHYNWIPKYSLNEGLNKIVIGKQKKTKLNI